MVRWSTPKKKGKPILFADGTHSNSLPLACDIGHLLPNQADDAVDDGVKDLFDFTPAGPPQSAWAVTDTSQEPV